MKTYTSPTIGVSSWALHRELGAPPIWGVEAGASVPRFDGPAGAHSLLELPASIAAHGFACWQLCHFHLPTREADYLDELRAASLEAGLSLHALLVDAGDLTHAQNGARDAAWIADWLPVAAQLGSENVRVIAGQSVHAGALEESARHLIQISRSAGEYGLGIITENWFDLLATPAAVRELLERTGSHVGLMLDWSNWNGTEKYERLAQIAPLARSCHVQVEFDDAGRVNLDDCKRCLQLPYPDDFNGPFVLVNGGLKGIETARDAIAENWRKRD